MGVPVRTVRGHHHELIRAADLVLVTSGTAALEVAFHEKPMIVLYQASRLFYHLVARWFLHTPHLSLPNILAGRRIVPEFMPYYRDLDAVARTALEILDTPDRRERIRADLCDVTAALRKGRASENTADLLLDMIDRR